MPTRLEQYEIAANAAVVTPNDSTDLTNSGVLYVGNTGNIKVDTVGGDTVTFTGVSSGTVLPVLVKRVYATDTTATTIMVLY